VPDASLIASQAADTPRRRGWMNLFAPTDVVRASRACPAWAPEDAAAACPRCGVSVGPGVANPCDPARGCARCRNQPPPWRRLTRLGAYAAPLDSWVRDMKYARAWTFGPHLGKLLAGALPTGPAPRPVLVVPVPLHWSRRWQRGYNQAQLMARSLAAARGHEDAAVLRRRRAAGRQTRLSATARAKNLRNAFVDDVKTTGATLTACVRVLKRMGAQNVDCAVAAVTNPPDGR